MFFAVKGRTCALIPVSSRTLSAFARIYLLAASFDLPDFV